LQLQLHFHTTKLQITYNYLEKCN